VRTIRCPLNTLYGKNAKLLNAEVRSAPCFEELNLCSLRQRFVTCGPRTPGGPKLFRKLNNFSQQINKVYVRKKSNSEVENFKTLCKSEGIWNWRLIIKLVNLPIKIKIPIFVYFFVCELNKIFRNLCICLLCIFCVLFWGSDRRNGLGVRGFQ
jgi:hypothetical protein